jgi:hypothetical protein
VSAGSWLTVAGGRIAADCPQHSRREIPPCLCPFLLNNIIEEEPTMCIRLMIVLGVACLLSCLSTASAVEPNWSNGVIAFGERRQQIESTDILYRPYRPLHFYGNTVRRRHYRGRAVPTARDFAAGARVLIRRR